MMNKLAFSANQHTWTKKQFQTKDIRKQ
uniref:Uncharacterized protein n=1 Tax=Anguilla anguilla TaxID=7936 RepID=A0A0E9PJU3_ANGAN